VTARDALTAVDLSKSRGDRAVLRRLGLRVPEGACLALRGDNGSGKTTLLRCLAGLLRPDAGAVRWFDQPADPRRAGRLLALVAHESHLDPRLTLAENLRFAARLLGVTDPRTGAARALGEAGLVHQAERLPREVSQGQRKRAALARALLVAPPLLLLDEPSAHLDDAGRRWLSDVLDRRRRLGMTTCLVMHDDPSSLVAPDLLLELRSGVLVDPSTPGPAAGREAA
jgi:heme ABC exporter ATP-binding subunit CcmA